MYLSSNYRPDINFEVHQCARFTHNSSRNHTEAVNSICRYLVGTQGQGLTFEPNSDMNMDCYVDADFSGIWKHEDDQDPVCVKSRTFYGMTLGVFPLYWVSTLQTEISLSTLEAECIDISQDKRDLQLLS